MSDYRVKVSVRNARILRAIKADGFRSVAAFCRFWGLNVHPVGAIIAMRTSPIGKEGRLSAEAQRLVDALCALPEDLWTDEQLWAKAKPVTVDVSSEQARHMLEDQNEAARLLGVLKPRERRVIESRFSAERTLEQVGKELGVTRERIREIEQGALRKMRNRGHLDELAAGEK